MVEATVCRLLEYRYAKLLVRLGNRRVALAQPLRQVVRCHEGEVKVVGVELVKLLFLRNSNRIGDWRCA